MTTSTRILIDLGQGTEAKDGSTPSSSDAISQGDLTDLATGAGVARKWATFEPDQWLLDGSHHLMPSTGAHVGFWSDVISGAGGIFSSPPELRMDFDTDYDLDYAISFYFDNATGIFCNDLDIDFYDSGDSLLDSQSFTPDDAFYKAEIDAVTGVRYIILTFNSTNVAYRHVRLTDIIFDTIQFTGDEIQSAEIVEEISPLSTSLPANSLDFSVLSEDADFSIIDPQSVFQYLRHKQKVDVFEIINGVKEYMGRFYLDDWSSTGEKTAKFSALDAIMLLDTPKFYCAGTAIIGGHPATYAYQLIGDIMETAGVEYDLDASLSGNINVWDVYSGMLPIMSCRDALRHVLFAIGGYADCSKSKVVKILPFQTIEPGESVDHVLTSSEMGANITDIRRRPITSLELISFGWAKKFFLDVNTLVSETLSPGRYFMTSQNPSYLFVWDTAHTGNVTPNDVGPWWIDFTIDTEDDYDLEDGGFNFEEQKNRNFIINDTVPVNTPPNEISITEAFLVKQDNHPSGTLTTTETIQRIFKYYLQRFQHNIRLFGRDVHVGESASVARGGKTIYGLIERVNLDLARGSLSNITVVGDYAQSAKSVKYNNTSTKFSYTGFPNTDNNVLHYQGDMRWSPSGETGSIDFYIIGYQFVFVYRQLSGGLEGSVNVYVDDALIDTIDQNGTTVYQQEWTSPVFDNTYHKVKIEKVGTTGTTNLDAIEVFYK